jgi:hypothetical protein
VSTFVGTDLCRNIVKDRFVLGKGNLRASRRGAAVCWIGAVRAAFSRNTEARNGLAGGRVRVKFRLKIFHVKSKVQNIDFFNFVFMHADPPVVGLVVSGADLMARDTFTAICRSTESSVLYANELLQCDCHRSEYRQIVLARGTGYAFVSASGNASVTL